MIFICLFILGLSYSKFINVGKGLCKSNVPTLILICYMMMFFNQLILNFPLFPLGKSIVEIKRS